VVVCDCTYIAEAAAVVWQLKVLLSDVERRTMIVLQSNDSFLCIYMFTWLNYEGALKQF